MVVYAGQGDVRRSMALLWRAEPTARAATGSVPGPRPALSVDMILDAAIGVADQVDMAGLSMRAVGERLGRSAMALYTYIPNKAELVDLMYDRILAELPTDYDVSGGWRAAVAAWAQSVRALYLRHPWVLQVSQVRPVLGPNEYAAMEALLRVLGGTGLPGPDLRHAVGVLVHFVRGAAQAVAESRQAPTATGVSDEEWWLSRSALLQEVAPDFAERFPLVHGLESEAATPPADGEGPYLDGEATRLFDAGLGLILDGIEALMARACPASAR